MYSTASSPLPYPCENLSVGMYYWDGIPFWSTIDAFERMGRGNACPIKTTSGRTGRSMLHLRLGHWTRLAELLYEDFTPVGYATKIATSSSQHHQDVVGAVPVFHIDQPVFEPPPAV